MPIEIRELHIRVAVDGETTASSTPSGNAEPASADAADREALVAECVEQVLQILQARTER